MIDHVFTASDGSIIATFRMAAGTSGCSTHTHIYEHDAFVVEGTVNFHIGSLKHTLEAPSTIRFPATCEHWFEAVTDALVICVHPKVS